jgi:transcription elongation factor Elf1
MTDLLPEKLRLKEYLERKGISYNQKLKTWRCPNHDDQRESATLYENIDGGILTCHVCGKSWDIFQVSGIINNLPEFKDQLKEVKDTLGTQQEKPIPKTQPSDTKKEKNPYLLRLIVTLQRRNIPVKKYLSYTKCRSIQSSIKTKYR